jgi:hypothetical protein
LSIYAGKCLFSQKLISLSKFSQKLAVLAAKKHQFFRQIFMQKYLKNHNIGPPVEAKAKVIFGCQRVFGCS